MIAIVAYNLIGAIFRGMGDSKTPFVFIAVATAVNVVLDLLFIAVMGLDAFGAALATVTGQAVCSREVIWVFEESIHQK